MTELWLTEALLLTGTIDQNLALTSAPRISQPALDELAERIRRWGGELGFQQTGVSDIDLAQAEGRFAAWLEDRFHGDMAYMSHHGPKRSRPDLLVPGTVRVISVRMDYLPEDQDAAQQLLDHPRKAYVSRYALGRDYHKVLRGRLRTLARRIEAAVGPYGHRVFVDSAPVLEKPLAEKAGLGWIGKHTNLLNRRAGSWFFLGELYTDIALPVDAPESSHCGSCRACIDVCPTGAIVAPYRLDARRCISYLTIELKGAIPAEFRSMIGNRIYGCDDCQLVCPWNKFAVRTTETDFAPRHRLDTSDLTELFRWDEATWKKNTEGSAIRRIGYEQWLRNIAVALGNAEYSPEVIAALQSRKDNASSIVREHVEWALRQQQQQDAPLNDSRFT
ncbi:MAG: tRNA epoxyqueuosine(34) reductase QueG [Woeseiaceae bacterium]